MILQMIACLQDGLYASVCGPFYLESVMPDAYPTVESDDYEVPDGEGLTIEVKLEERNLASVSILTDEGEKIVSVYLRKSGVRHMIEAMEKAEDMLDVYGDIVGSYMN